MTDIYPDEIIAELRLGLEQARNWVAERDATIAALTRKWSDTDAADRDKPMLCYSDLPAYAKEGGYVIGRYFKTDGAWAWRDYENEPIYPLAVMPLPPPPVPDEGL